MEWKIIDLPKLLLHGHVHMIASTGFERILLFAHGF
jgi:hypothetical protein